MCRSAMARCMRLRVMTCRGSAADSAPADPSRLPMGRVVACLVVALSVVSSRACGRIGGLCVVAPASVIAPSSCGVRWLAASASLRASLLGRRGGCTSDGGQPRDEAARKRTRKAAAVGREERRPRQEPEESTQRGLERSMARVSRIKQNRHFEGADQSCTNIENQLKKLQSDCTIMHRSRR